MSMKNHAEILGHKVKDKVTGFKGVATSISFDLYGCVQIIIHPPMDKEGKHKDGMWFDIARVEITHSKRVMPVPKFEINNEEAILKAEKGAAEKPLP